MTLTSDRRAFLQVVAGLTGSLVLGIRLPVAAGKREPTAEPWAPNAWLAIDPDGSITITVARAEMGQGVRTALPMIVAEELGADLSRIRIVQGDLDQRYGEQFAGGSAVVRTSWQALRVAGAAAREMLITAAASIWGVAATECRARSGSVIHQGSGRRLSFGELVESAARQPVPPDPRLKDPSEFTLLGQATRSLDAPAIVDGTIRFGLDVRVPGMLVAAVERSPRFGGTVGEIDDAAARAVPGVVAVVSIDAGRLPDFGPNNPKMVNGVAVVARSTWAALQGRRALRVRWVDGAGAAESTDAMRQRCIAAAEGPDRFTGDFRRGAEPGPAVATRRLSAVYENQLLAHAPMEPMNCTASVADGRCEIWAPSQMPDYARRAAEAVTGFPAGAITVHVTRMGGAFGRRFYADYVGEAVYVSRAVQRPVQVMWTREDDMRYGFYRPAGYHVLEGALNRQGEPVAWSHRLFNASRGHFLKWSPAADFNPGELTRDEYPARLAENFRFSYTPIDSPIPRGQWRAVEASMNVFVIQSFLDELAHLAEKDPLEFRLALLGRYPEPLDPERGYQVGRLANVLRVAATAAGWGGPVGSGRGRGIAAHWGNETYVAEVAEVVVAGDGSYRVERVVCAVDCGLVINPLGVRAQVEGSIAYGLSAALREEITVQDGRVVQGNFVDYPILRIGEMPVIETHIVPSTSSLGGMGEPALPPLAPAVTNAIFAATGRRIRRLPIGPRVSREG